MVTLFFLYYLFVTPRRLNGKRYYPKKQNKRNNM